ncbi:MAG TPA: hypothetical protein VFI65_11200 [Streptosporangiaceae bacterium]|nr:hypothetical protein [Streptosporangiaceae bacterium]
MTAVSEATRPLAGRRRIDPSTGRVFQASMRNDFLTPRGTPYKWQELTASVERTVIGGGGPTVVPVRYEWQRVDAQVGNPDGAQTRREWTFARGQSFTSLLLHTELEGVLASTPDFDGPTCTTMDISYPGLPKSPAVDLLLMLSWDVVTFEMMATNLITTPELREVGGCTNLERISGTWAELRFSDPRSTAVFKNARGTARHLGCGRVDGRPTLIFTSTCLDCELDVRSGPLAERGRSSYWLTLQVDAENADLLSAEMTEMIVATLTGPEAKAVPVCKRRTVRLWTGLDPSGLGPAQPSSSGVAQRHDPEVLAEAIRFAGQVAQYLAWQVSSLENLPPGMSELALMGFRSLVGADLASTFLHVKALQTDLKAAARSSSGQAALAEALPEHRRRLEGLLAFGQLAADGTNRGLVLEEADRRATRAHLQSVSNDLTALLGLIEKLEQS